MASFCSIFMYFFLFSIFINFNFLSISLVMLCIYSCLFHLHWFSIHIGNWNTNKYNFFSSVIWGDTNFITFYEYVCERKLIESWILSSHRNRTQVVKHGIKYTITLPLHHHTKDFILFCLCTNFIIMRRREQMGE